MTYPLSLINQINRHLYIILLSRQEYWGGMPFPSQGSSWLRDWTQVSRIAGKFFTIWTTRDYQFYSNKIKDK